MTCDNVRTECGRVDVLCTKEIITSQYCSWKFIDFLNDYELCTLPVWAPLLRTHTKQCTHTNKKNSASLWV